MLAALRRFTEISLILGAATALVLAQGKGPIRRAEPPKFTAAEAESVFFPDVTKEFKGERPGSFGGGRPAANTGGNPVANTGGNTAPAAGGSGVWAKLISPTTIEDEIKAIKQELDKDVTVPTKFAGGDYKRARRHFSMLALMFAVTAEYDGDVRFKKDASNARLLFSRSAANCKVGTEGAYQEAKIRKEDLEGILSGSGLKNNPGDAQFDWGKVADRSPLMQRLETVHNGNLKGWTADPKEFNNRAEQILHEVEILAAVAELLKQKGMKDADVAEYAGYCDTMLKNSAVIIDAVKGKRPDDARKAVGEIDKACTSCHEQYRS